MTKFSTFQDRGYVRRLAQLCDTLRWSKDFGGILNRFLEEVGCDSAFLDAGRPYSSDWFAAVIRETVRNMPNSASVNGLRLMRVAEARFVHGILEFEGGMGIVIYFEDAMTGLVGVRRCGALDTMVSRFSMVPMRAHPEGFAARSPLREAPN